MQLGPALFATEQAGPFCPGHRRSIDGAGTEEGANTNDEAEGRRAGVPREAAARGGRGELEAVSQQRAPVRGQRGGGGADRSAGGRETDKADVREKRRNRKV